MITSCTMKAVCGYGNTRPSIELVGLTSADQSGLRTGELAARLLIEPRWTSHGRAPSDRTPACAAADHIRHRLGSRLRSRRKHLNLAGDVVERTRARQQIIGCPVQVRVIQQPVNDE